MSLKPPASPDSTAYSRRSSSCAVESIAVDHPNDPSYSYSSVQSATTAVLNTSHPSQFDHSMYVSDHSIMEAVAYPRVLIAKCFMCSLILQ